MACVQVIIPCYNYGRYLHLCALSALSQTGVDVKVLIIDDKSSDNTPEICDKLSSEDARVSIIRHEVNRGHIATYNEGISLTTSDYLVLLSADDLLIPGALSRAAALMNHNPSVGLVYGNPISLFGSILPRPRQDDTGWTIWSGSDWVERMCLTGKNFIVNPEVMMRTSVQHRLNGYKSSLPHSADMELWLRAAAISDVGHLNGADQAYYRIHDASMQRTIHAGYLYDLKARRDAFRSALEDPVCELSNIETLLENANRALALTALRHVFSILDAGRAESEPVGELFDFALDLYPGIKATRLWHRVQSALRAKSGPIPLSLAKLRTVMRKLDDRKQWRHWYRTGVY